MLQFFYVLSEILKVLSIETFENNSDLNIIDIKDLQNSNPNEITFFHSKKYKNVPLSKEMPNYKQNTRLFKLGVGGPNSLMISGLRSHWYSKCISNAFKT